MEKRLILAVLLSTVILFTYYSFLDGKQHEQETIPGEVEQEEVRQTAVAGPRLRETEKPAIAEKAGENIPIDTELLRLVFTSSGGKIKNCRLKKYKVKLWSQKELQGALKPLERQIASIDRQIAQGKPRAEAQKEALIRQKNELLFKGRDSGIRTARIKELRGDIAGEVSKESDIWNELAVAEAVELVPDYFEYYPFAISLPGIIDDKRLNTLPYEPGTGTNNEGDKTISLTGLVDGRLSIVKKLTFKPDTYGIDVEITFKNIGKEPLTEKNGLIIYGPGVGVDERSSPRGRGSKGGIVCSIGGRVKREQTVKTFFSQPTLLPDVPKLHKNAEWVALTSEYFSAILIPHKGIDTARVLGYGNGRKEIGLCIPAFTLAPGKCLTSHFGLYLGPLKTSALRNAADGLERIIDFGFWGPVAVVINSALHFFYRLVGNYGMAIILLSLAIKLLFYPLTHKSFESMSKMQEDMKVIQPKMQSLREKYKDNPQKLNREMMNLYKKEGVNPLSGCKGGCLPMLLQMPVFFALYSVLYNSIELRQAPFLGWINDLSAPDPKKVLPILMGVSMFFQQKLMSPTTAGTPEQQSQAKIMSWMMPVFLTYIFFGLPSGVVLYWFAFNVFTTLQQLLVKKKKMLTN